MKEEWKTVLLGELITLQRGFDLPKRNWKPGNVPIVSSSGVIGSHNQAQVVGPGVITGRYGTIGQVFFIDEDFWPHNTTLFVSDFKGNNPLFVSFLLKTIDFHTHSGKSGVPGVNRNDLHEITVHQPPIKEQEAIAAALSDVDGLLAGLDRLIAKKRAVKTAVMQQLLTGEVRVGAGNDRWSTIMLGSVSDIRTGKKNNEDKVEDGRYPFFVRSQTVERINTFSFDGEAILIPGEGDIGNIFHYINGRFDYHQRVYKVSDFSPLVCGKYIYYYMLLNFHKQATRNSVKATVDSLRLPTFQQFEMLIPEDVEEQRTIAAILSDIDAEIAALETRRAKTAAIKQGMMQELLTGRTRLL